jgi:adenylate cyclase class 2
MSKTADHQWHALPSDEALRLRRVGDDVAATWKGPRIDSASKTRRELELGLAPVPPLPGGPRGGQATLDRWTELLEALGFRRVRDVAKRRQAARVLALPAIDAHTVASKRGSASSRV